MEDRTFLTPMSVVHAAHLELGMRVADLGAGSGFFTRAAAHAVGEQGVVWAVDVDQNLLSRIKNVAEAEGLKNVEVLSGDVQVVGGTNLPAESLDVAIAANLLFTIEHKHECVAEIRRILKKNGEVVVVDWSDSHGGLGPHPSHVVSRAEAQKLFETQGFLFMRAIPAGTYHWGFIARKK